MFWLCKAAVPRMRPGSTIINTSSIQAYQSSSQLLDYATTKAGIVAFTKALAEDLADKGVRVNAVAPGPIWTPLIPATMPEDKVESFGEDTPMGRAGQPAELAPAYVFFASQESSYVSGGVLGVTGANRWRELRASAGEGNRVALVEEIAARLTARAGTLKGGWPRRSPPPNRARART
jgi:NAD(P)-dependent dehydrogenase (short-subunit alcohol dehydrogenase family)